MAAGTIADNLAGKGGDQHGAVGEELLKKYPDGFNAGHIAGKGEKRRERGKQAPIHGFEGVPVKDQKRRHDDKQPRLIWHGPQHHGDRQTKEQAIRGGPPRLQRDDGFRYTERFLREGKAAEQDQRGGQEKGRQHDGNKRADGNVEEAEQIQVLRISEGRDHTAEVCGAVLQNKEHGGVLFLPGGLQDKPAQRQKRQQRRVVGEQHGAEHRYDHQRGADAADGAERAYHTLRQRGKYLHIPQRADDGQHAEKTHQRFDIVIACIIPVRGGRCRR